MLPHLGQAYLDAIVGDLDSVTDHTRELFGTMSSPPLVIHEPDQNSTDFGKAIKYIRSLQSAKSETIVVLGSMGGRVDQSLSLLHHLYMMHEQNSRLVLLGGSNVSVLLTPGKHVLRVRRCSTESIVPKESSWHNQRIDVGILPLQGRAIITTHGFQWDVRKWETEMGGQLSTSNLIKPMVDVVTVETSTAIIFTTSVSVNVEY